jgi:hypothetical protein
MYACISLSNILLGSALVLATLLPIQVDASDSESMSRLRAAVHLIKRRIVDETGCYSCGHCRSRARGQYGREGKSYIIPTTLYHTSRTYNYYIIGAGDNGVDDLDLELYDSNFNLVDKDTKRDNLPILTYTPRRTGRYYIRVKTYEGRGYSNVAICHVQPE